MKKIIISIITLIILGSVTFFIVNNKEENKLTKVKVAEVAHTIFYTPWYVAIEKNYFEDEGIDLELILTPGANKVASAVLSKDVNIGFSGPEATIYVYNGKEKNYLINFAGLTKRDGSFIVSRKKDINFNILNMKKSYIIGGRKGGMPEMNLEWALKQNKINPKKDLTIDTSISFSAMSGAFIKGTGDYVTLFEPTALNIEKQNLGHVVASVGKYSGEVPYTTFYATKNYINNNKSIIKHFKKAIEKGMKYVENHSDSEIADVIIKQFPNTSKNDLIEVIKRYRENDSWYYNTDIKKEAYYRMIEIMKNANQLEKAIHFNILFKNEIEEN